MARLVWSVGVCGELQISQNQQFATHSAEIAEIMEKMENADGA
jgi:hypothetical protein